MRPGQNSLLSQLLSNLPFPVLRIISVSALKLKRKFLPTCDLLAHGGDILAQPDMFHFTREQFIEHLESVF